MLVEAGNFFKIAQLLLISADNPNLQQENG
jgi:hypothetical protein